jgi:RHS repeat-associated protein
VQTQVKKGVAANPPFPAQPDITTTYTYDAEGRTLTETVTSSTLSLSRSSQYDKAGRLILETDNAGISTGYAYTNGGRTQTVTRPNLPGGATQIIDKYLDSRTKSITGTAVVARYYDYGVNADGTQYTQEFIGPSGLTSPRWTKTTTDWLGRAIYVEKSSYLGATLVRTSTYNNKGQLQVERVLENWTSKLQADTLHEYDDLGNQIRVGLDVNADGALTALSPDRYVGTNVVYQKTGTDWFRVTTTTTYLIDNNATATTLRTEQERLTNFPLSGTEQTVSDVTVTDVAGNQTRTTSGIDRAAKKGIERTYAPDSTTVAVRITVNGLLQSTAPTTPETATTYAYDTLGRLTGVTDPRTGTTTRAYNAGGQLISTSDAVQTTSYDYYPATDPNAGRLKSQTNGNNKKVYFNYNSRGELIQTWGDTTYPLEYVYDGYGQRTELHTFRGGLGWQSATWPTGATGTVDVTLWGYDVSSGLVTSKQDASGIAFYTAYDTLGRLVQRTWARNTYSVVTNYAYDLYTGQQTTVTYTDATPAVAFVYDRGGRPVLVTDAAGTHTLTPNAAGQAQTEAIASGILDGVSITHGYDPLLRPNALQTTLNGVTLTSQSYTYDPTGRLGTVTNSGQTATYAYDPSAGFLNTTTFTSGLQLSRAYDPVGRLQSISTAIVSPPPLVSYTYGYNNLSQRTRATREDSSYWSYGYNDRGELTSGLKYWSDNTLVAGQQFTYNFDNIGNRSTTQAGGDALGGSLRTSTYTPNNLNQYTQRTVPNAVDILGRAQSTATVTVNTQAAYRRADYFQKAATLDNSDDPVYGQINVLGVRPNVGPNGENAVTQQSGSVYLPYTPEAYTYDYDGNLISDGSWNYTWDAENRLIRIESITSVPNEAKKMLELAYDYLGRRIQKRVYAWDSSANAILLQSTTRFIYDGWNLIAELDGSGTLIRSYAWGQDLSGSLQGAGGVGGLLLINEAGNSYIAGYDGNGNITSLVKASTGTNAASYDYNPFGETLQATGDYAARNPFKFSTKYTDQETGLLYYGYRYYNPQIGRWISRDPIGEKGSVNLYLFNSNNPLSRFDPNGLQILDPSIVLRLPRYDYSSPNWDFALGGVNHTYHSITLCIPDIDKDRALSRIFDDLQVFNHFNSPTENVARFSVTGSIGHFSITNPLISIPSYLIGNSVDIEVVLNPSRKEVSGVTLGVHPLVGVRKWWVEEAGQMILGRGAIVKVITEAYEQPNGIFNYLGHRIGIVGWNQDQMWQTYLNNIGSYWKDNYKAKVLKRDYRPPTLGGKGNPFRLELPPRLQRSRYFNEPQWI